MPRSLELVVTAVATRLIAVDAATATGVSQQVLAELVTYFDVDFSFLRHNDHGIHATRLIAEWPPRTEDVRPDPLELVYFADAEPVFALAEDLKKGIVRARRPVQDGLGVGGAPAGPGGFGGAPGAGRGGAPGAGRGGAAPATPGADTQER